MLWLKNPYPFIFEDSKSQLKMTALVIVFVALFLYVFRPFNYDEILLIDPLQASILYGFVAGIVSLIVTKMFIAFAPEYTAEKNWNIGKQLFFLNLILLAVTLANLIFSYGFQIHDLKGRTFLECLIQDLTYTYAIGFFPVLIVTLVGFYIRLKRNLAAAEELNKKIEFADGNAESQNVRLVIPSNAKSDDLEINVQDLVFVMADGNYVEFHLKDENRTQRKIIRNTMSNVEEHLNDFDFLFRSHRAYIVNLNFIRESSGNAQGYQLKMKNTDTILPVSRTNLDRFKNVIESNRQNPALHFVPNS